MPEYDMEHVRGTFKHEVAMYPFESEWYVGCSCGYQSMHFLDQMTAIQEADRHISDPESFMFGLDGYPEEHVAREKWRREQK